MASSEQSAPRDRNSESNYTNLYIKYFPQAHGEEELCELFGGYGPIQAVKIMTDARGRKSAFVNFEQHDDACSCVQDMHKRDLRSRAEKKAASKAEAEGNAQPVIVDGDGHPEHLLFVSRAQSKAERQEILQKQYEGKGGGGFQSTGSSSKGSSKGKDGKRDAAAPQSYINGTHAYGAMTTPSAVLSVAPPTQADYSANNGSRSAASCGFQQHLQQQRYYQQPAYYGAGAFCESEGAGCNGSVHYDGGYFNNGYGTADGDGNYYAWGSYGSGNFHDAGHYLQQSF